MGTNEISLHCLPTLAPLAFWIGQSFVLKDGRVHCEMFSNIAGLCLLHVRSMSTELGENEVVTGWGKQRGNETCQREATWGIKA